jgi:hypothetical protein
VELCKRPRLETRIDWLAFKGQHTEDAFMYPAERLLSVRYALFGFCMITGKTDLMRSFQQSAILSTGAKTDLLRIRVALFPLNALGATLLGLGQTAAQGFAPADTPTTTANQKKKGHF